MRDRVLLRGVKRLAPLAALLALVATGALIAGLTMGDDSRWTFQGEHAVLVREEVGRIGSGMIVETRSTARIWFHPGVGWRMEVESEGAHGTRHRFFGTDGTAVWNFDPLSNRYTITPAEHVIGDPRAVMAVTMATASTYDFDSALAAMQQLPDVTVDEEGHDRIAGRPARIVRISPYGCTTVVGTPPSPQVPTGRSCAGATRYWLDAATGWVLKAEGDDGHGGGFAWDTRSAAFGKRIDPSLFRFSPRPGSVKAGSLD